MDDRRHSFEDLVPSWLFGIRSPLARVAVAGGAAGLLSLPLLLVDAPGDLRLAPVLTLGLVAVSSLAGWWATAASGAVLLTVFWWNGIPPEESFSLPNGSAQVSIASLVVLVVGLVLLSRRIERAVTDVRALDVQRQIESWTEATTRADAERDTAQVRAVLALSSTVAQANTVAEAARLALDAIDIPTRPSTGSIAIVREGHLQVLAAIGSDPRFISALERVDIRQSPWLGDVLNGAPAFVDDRDAFAAAHPSARVLQLYPTGSWAVVPFRSETNVGLLSVHFIEQQQLSEHQLYFSLLGEIIANAIERAHAEERRREHVAQLEHSFAERDRIARTLSTTLLPPRLPALRGCTAAGWLIPASADEVAGDFYDLFSLPDGGWVAVLGDVCGKGAEAAAVTSLARYAARVTALDDPDPLRIAEVANAALEADPSDLFCTMAIVRYRPSEEVVEVVLAGHPKVRLVGRGRVDRAGTYGAPLGLAQRPHQVERHPFGPGDRVVLFSDGLVERNPVFGEDELDLALKGMVGDARDVARGLQETVLAVEGVRLDDLAVLVVARAD